MRIARQNLAALGLTLLAVGSVGLGARCLSVSEARCSIASLTGNAPKLDVPYAVTRPELIARMLDMAGVGPGTRVLDLGTGDGRILLAAARRGATGLGVDIDPVLVAEARDATAREGLSGRARFEARDLFATPVGGHDVVTMFLLPEVNLRLRPRLLAELAPGARVVSHAFDMGDWRPDATSRVGGARVYLWRVPSRVAGTWRLVDGDGEAGLVLRQRYQDVTGTLGSRPVEGRLEGTRLSLVVGLEPATRLYVGEARGDDLVGTDRRWRATRLSRPASLL